MARDGAVDTAQAHSVFVRLVLPPYTIHFKSPTYMKESTLELLDGRVCKEVLKSSASSSEVREAIGSNPKYWSEIVTLLRAAVISLERRSFQIWDPSGADYESTSGALIASNYPGLWKDLERLNNLVSISRNVLTAGVHVQDLAAEHAVELEIFKLINCAVRVTARGYDGEAGTGEEEKWQYIVNNYKKLLITSLQFLNNLVAQNERRKLMLWVNLFDSTSDALLNQDDNSGQVNVPARLLKEPVVPIGKEDLLLAYGEYEDQKLDLEGAIPLFDDIPFQPLPKEALRGKPTYAPNGYVLFAKNTKDLTMDDYRIAHERDATIGELHLDVPRRWAELNDSDHAYWQKKWEAMDKKYHNDVAMYETRLALMEGGQVTSNGTLEDDQKIVKHLFKLEDDLHVRFDAELQTKSSEPALHRGTSVRDKNEAPSDMIDSDSMKMLFTAEAGTKILESGKAELMKRLEGYEKPEEALDTDHEYHEEPPPLVRRASAPEGFPAEYRDPNAEAWSVASEEPRPGSEEPEEDDYPGSTEDGRGLLTDVPLILGPSEIEVLPMIVMSGIVAPPAQLLQCKTTAERNALINMHTVRCHLLFAQDNGRNLLRELLIFVAAWDLREEELYFKFMVKIMEAILQNGLMPYAYHAFRDRSRSKDIISPAQAVIMKLLTNIFRARSEANKASASPNTASPRPTAKPAAGQISHSLLPSTPQRVDVHILNYIFTEFRQHIIPQTCALIFLQGQIHLGRASPEDFPLNLWDMERMYEGVYQYLEFFAVLTEEGFWKGVLGGWQIASELVTLLRELEGGIPKMQIHVERAPRPAPDRQLSMPNLPSNQIRASSADARQGAIFEAETPLAYPEDAQDEPSDFEWRNLKKLTVLVLSSLIWKNQLVQDQVRTYGGLEALVACCKQDEHNPYIREHAIMCLRFAVEDNNANATVIRKMAAQGERRGRQRQGEYDVTTYDVPREVLDANGYETFMDGKGQIGLRRKEPQLPTVPTLGSSQVAARQLLPPMQAAAGMAKLTPEKAAELMQNALKELPLGMGASLAKGLEGLMKGEK
ncbi:hypothetical protein AMS68_007387 [Peltaster fructicola]|uniref:Ataxin-10 homolog n=1 Tax=Peltaster fructicola TaxID=286661 RepID=A0A6H0Y5J7_9PEZI|nr:hypothetical protein AMS68_007387 [Peltaster fructicola]